MCGIVGVLSYRNNTLPQDTLIKMRDDMVHRGPDDAGIYVEDNIALGHRRLSIIDLSSGHQPMSTQDNYLHIVFNGEIYNYRELRQQLVAKGYQFRTHSDTEVLLAMYQEYGAQCVNQLNGIFAFAIWNKKQKELFVARDHMGIKPLYYHENAEALIFASEVKSLFASGYLNAQTNLDALSEYFVFRHVAGERTLFKDVKALLPGHYLLVKNGQISVKKYWSPLVKSTSPSNFDDAVDELEQRLKDAVQLQMVSDVPLGTFCSGGIDSSLVSALASKVAGKPINTFSIGFDEKAYDESEYARIVSKKYNTQHHELRVGNVEFSDYLSDMVWHNDEPLNFPNSVHIYALSRLAKEYVTVVLTGEGADELFGGYPRYHIARYIEKLHSIPGPMRTVLGKLLGISNDHRLKKLSNYLGKSMENILLYNCATLESKRINEIVGNNAETRFPYRTEIIRSFESSRSALKRVTLQDQHSYLVSILNRQDKMSMAASIESRVPILDYRLVEFANSLPDNFKQKGTQTKLILKKVAERHLPHEVVYRRKSGFGIPLAEWFRDDKGLGQLAKDAFTDQSLSELSENINAKAVLSEHLSGKVDHSEFLWTTLNYLLWKKAFKIT